MIQIPFGSFRIVEEARDRCWLKRIRRIVITKLMACWNKTGGNNHDTKILMWNTCWCFDIGIQQLEVP